MSETPQEFVTRWLNQVPTPVQEHVREAIQAVLAEIERLRLHMDGCGRTTANLAKSAEAAEAERDALRIDLQTADDRNRALRAEVERLRAGIEDNAARWSEMARALTAKAERAEAALYEAAMSLETIAEAGGSTHLSDGLLEAMSQVRGYARNRAGVARAALAGEGK